jgi:hypothetical protein
MSTSRGSVARCRNRVVARDSEVDAALAAAASANVGGLLIGADSFFFFRTERLAAVAFRHRLPALFGFREFAMAGGLISYGASPAEQHRIVGHYIGRILKGEKRPIFRFSSRRKLSSSSISRQSRRSA